MSNQSEDMMEFEIEIIFFHELNDFLPQSKREKSIRLSQKMARSIKDLIESMGIPHTEVGNIKLDGVPVDSSQVVSKPVRIEVYPFSIKDLRSVDHLHPNEVKFLGDVHLGSMVRKLRLLGLDTVYSNKWTDLELASISVKEDRMLLTRDRHLLMRKIIKKGLYVRSTDPEIQVPEVLGRLRLRDICKPFTRCLICNGLLISLDENTDLFQSNREKIPPKVQAWCRNYSICRLCGKIYWEGSHFTKLQAMVNVYLA